MNGYYPGDKSHDPIVKCFVDDDENLFLHGALFAAPGDVFLCACHDGTPVVKEGKNYYYPADWLIKNYSFPEGTTSEIFAEIKGNILSAHRENIKEAVAYNEDTTP